MVLPIDHYEVLGVPPTATFEEIKTAFRHAALRLHPDKKTNSGSNETDTFLKIQQAWNTLSTSESRAVYDLQRTAAEARDAVHITDTILAENMESGTTENGEAMVSYPCRCGGIYAVLSEDLCSHQRDNISAEGDRGEEGGGGEVDKNKFSSDVVVPCSTCSLHILVVLRKPNIPASST